MNNPATADENEEQLFVSDPLRESKPPYQKITELERTSSRTDFF